MTEESKPEVEEEFWVFRYKNILEKIMLEQESKVGTKQSIDVAKIVDFQDRLFAFKLQLRAAVELYLDFWRELQEHNPDVQKLHDLGSRLTNVLEQVAEEFKSLIGIYPNHLKLIQLYGHFLRDIINDDSEGQRLIDR